LVASLIAVGAVVVGFPLLMYLMQDSLIFFRQPVHAAQRDSIARRFPAVESVFIQADVRLHAWHIPGSPLVLYFGGNAEEVSWMLEEAPRRAPGVGWLLIDYRGYGSSEGSPSEAALTSDGLAWYDYATRELKANKVFLFGRSLGSGVAVHLAAERPVAGVILVAPFDSLVEVGKHHYPYLPVDWMLKHRFDSVARAPGIGVPLLCLAAEYDEIIPVEHSRRLYEAWGGAKHWVGLRGARHNSTDSAPGFWENIWKFLMP
jgi:pimeloyl-ACP methyl ester carboxylesterase